MGIFGKSVEEKLKAKQEEERLAGIEYYKFREPCYRCGQPIINYTCYPNTCKVPVEERYSVLSGTYDYGHKINMKPDIIGDYSVSHEQHISQVYPDYFKMFYHHWKCPTEKIDIPKDIIEETNRNIRDS